MGAREIGSEGSTEYLDMVITIKTFDGETVTFSVSQKWTTDCSVEWIATTCNISDDQIRCDKENGVGPDQSFTYTAQCVDNWAEVTVFVYDESFDTTDDPSVPVYCTDTDVVGNKAAYTFTLPCDCSTPPMDTSPRPAPTRFCDFYDVSFDGKELARGSYVSLQWKEHGMRISAGELDDGTGGYRPNGFSCLFDTAHPVDNAGYGTPGLAGDFGNVLIV